MKETDEKNVCLASFDGSDFNKGARADASKLFG